MSSNETNWSSTGLVIHMTGEFLMEMVNKMQ
jgi:hypothetical protein